MAAKPEWGAKRCCAQCNARFYDMRRRPIVCPKCGAAFEPEAVFRSRRGKVVEASKPPPGQEPETGEATDAEADDDTSLIEDTSELAGEDDLPPVEKISAEDDDQ